MELGLAGKVAIVTGASRGIGRAIATGLAAEGVNVVCVARDNELLNGLSDEIAAAGHPKPTTVVQDLMDENAPERVHNAACDSLGRVDILVNNAGGSNPVPLDAPEKAWADPMTLCFVRQRQLAHAVIPEMIERNWGRIINITGKSEPERLSPTGPAKAAMHSWSKQISRQVGHHGITVNCIPPGKIMSDQIRRKYPPEYREEFARTQIPAGYWGEPSDLAVLAVFLASPLARYINGAVIPVDGGLRRYQF